MTDAVPTQELDVEQSLIGAVLSSPKKAGSIIDMVRSEWFYRPLHRAIWQVAEAIHAEGNMVLRIALVKALERKGHDALKMKLYLETCFESRCVEAAVKTHGDILHRAHMLRLIRDECERISALSVADEADPIILMGLMGQAHDAAQKQIAGTLPSITLTQQLDEWCNKLLDRMDRGGQPDGWPTGIKKLDQLTGGVLPKKFWVIQAETSGGKSSFMIQMAYRLAMDGISVSIDSHEMSESDIISRIVAQISGIDLTKLTFDVPTGEEAKAALAFAEQLRKLTPRFNLQKHTSDSIDDVLRSAASIEGLQVLFIDYIQLLTSGKTDRRIDVDNIARKIQNFCGTTGIAVVALAQINDDGTTRESRAIKHAADVVFHIQHLNKKTTDPDGFETFEDDGKPTSKVMGRVTKHRNGPRGRLPMLFHKARTLFVSPEEGDYGI